MTRQKTQFLDLLNNVLGASEKMNKGIPMDRRRIPLNSPYDPYKTKTLPLMKTNPSPLPRSSKETKFYNMKKKKDFNELLNYYMNESKREKLFRKKIDKRMAKAGPYESQELLNWFQGYRKGKLTESGERTMKEYLRLKGAPEEPVVPSTPPGSFREYLKRMRE